MGVLKYKITVEFEVTDDQDEIRKELDEKGKSFVEAGLTLGFADPDFHNIKCTIKAVE